MTKVDLSDLDLPPDIEQVVQSALNDDREQGGRYDYRGFVDLYGSAAWSAYAAATAAG